MEALESLKRSERGGGSSGVGGSGGAEGPSDAAASPRVLKRAYEVAKAFRVTVHDSLYIAACEKEKAKLVTRDARQAKVAKDLGLEAMLV